MIAIRINGRKHFCPSSWNEVTVKQYVQILTQWDPDKDIVDRDYSKLLSILVGDKFRGIINAAEVNVTLISLVGWVVTSQLPKDLPLGVRIGKKTVPVPQDLSEVSIGQMIHLRRDFMEKAKYLEENLSLHY